MIDYVEILIADFNDMADILELQKLAFASEGALYHDSDIEPLTQTLDSIHEDFKNYIFLKAVYNNTIVGSVKIGNTSEYCWVGRLMVNPGFQNKGIGRKLMIAAEQQYPDAKQYLLYTGYKSLKNIKLYESLGYIKSGDYCNDRNPELKLIKMVKRNMY